MFFFRNIDSHNSRLNRKRVVIPKGCYCWFVAGICLIGKLKEYTNDHSLDACIIPTFYNKFLQLKLKQIFSGKIAFKLISTNFYKKNICPKKTKRKKNQNKVNEAKKFLKTLNINQF